MNSTTLPATEVMIGLEVHVQLNTQSKLFCSCPTHPSKDIPNSATCPICLGHPGTKPVTNKQAIAAAIKLACALQGKLASELVFSRKTYFYPDLAKNFQITQYEIPLATGGKILLESGKAITLKRLHVEEDPAAIVREPACSLVDYNRSGIPLCEIVTEPCLSSPEEAREFLKKLLEIMEYLDIFHPEDTIKADTNVSIKKTNFRRVEIKNVTGFKEVERALVHEIKRQQSDAAGVVQETRGWNAEKGLTYAMRSKEDEEDYGYILEPDLPPYTLPLAWIAEIQATIPELGREKAARFVKQWKIDPTDASILASEKKLAELYERMAKEVNPILTARWMRRELLRALNSSEKTIEEINERNLLNLFTLLDKKAITDAIGQELMKKIIIEGIDPQQYVKQHQLGKVNDLSELTNLCKEAITENPKAVEDYKQGEPKAFQALVGSVMKKTKGKGDPKIINETLKGMLR
ncbi:Asp-tRNA(Asn)/Glu-tRNA(Gln) amidotransferase subunit GatB [Candidatus Woesearchaeota archaeon]|nr:Asp-tRNA(Asn)/Glu-tRNA(Gln) amidotransferase subunit GatB [Candidatus Woesearchaeota archaeon]